MLPESNLVWGIGQVRCSESILRTWSILLMVNSEPIESTGSFRYIGSLCSHYMGISLSLLCVLNSFITCFGIKSKLSEVLIVI